MNESPTSIQSQSLLLQGRPPLTTKHNLTIMKKSILILTVIFLSMTAGAQNSHKPTKIHLKNGTVDTFSVDTIKRITIIPELGMKIYFANGTSRDYLESQYDSITYHTPDLTGNSNRNDISIAKEAWRLEYPKLNEDTENNQVVVKYWKDQINFSLEWNRAIKSNRWTCYEMYNGNTADNGLRTDKFKPDPDIPTEYQTYPAQYKKTGFDQGHLCPAGDRQMDWDHNDQTFYMSNMQPQYGSHNRGLWKKLEEKVRSWNTESMRDTLYVVKAATINPENLYPQDEVSIDLPVPKYFYMAILCRKGDEYHAIGFWTEHLSEKQNSKQLGNYAVSIKKLQSLTGLDFFCNLPDATEDQVEKECDLDFWGLTGTPLISSEEGN